MGVIVALICGIVYTQHMQFTQLLTQAGEQ